MRTYSFQFLAGQEHLSANALRHIKGLFLDVKYTSFMDCVSVYSIGASVWIHKNIMWTPEIYKEISEAAKHNYESQYQKRLKTA